MTRLAAIRHLALGPAPRRTSDSVMRRYFGDLLAGHGLSFDENLFVAGNGNGFVDLSSALVEAMDPGPLDLVVIAHAFPDCDPRRSAASALSSLCGGNPLVFAVTDQGVVSPFTAIDIALAYGCERSLVIIVDQTTTPYPEPALCGATTDHIVGLLIGPDGPGGFGTRRQFHDVAPDRVREIVDTELAAMDTVLLGGAAGQLCTGVWSALAAGMAGWSRTGQRIAAVDYDPALGCLCVLEIEVGPC